MPASLKVAFSIEPATLHRVDVEARKRRVSRSRFIRDAIDAVVRESRARNIAERFDAVFADPATTAHQRKTSERFLRASSVRGDAEW